MGGKQTLLHRCHAMPSSTERPDQPPILGLGLAVRIAGDLFQAAAVRYGDNASCAPDRSGGLQRVQGDRDSGSPDCKHHRQELVRELYSIPFRSVVAHQEPTGEALRKGVLGVRSSRQRRLDVQGLRITQ